MKRFSFLAVLSIFLALPIFAQTAPTATPDQKVSILQAQHKLDAIEKQKTDLKLEIADIQQKITDASQKLDVQQKAAQSDLDKANAAVTAGVDDKLWKWDHDALTFSAVTPAAPANASTQPAKPAPSPGAAAPPDKLAKK
jgi:hypothetical protein